MKAKCPHCFGEKPDRIDCPKCGGSSFIDAGFAEGALYTRACQNPACGYENGGYIVEPDRPKGPHGEPPEPPRDCVQCGAPSVWKKLADSMDGFVEEFEREIDRIEGEPTSSEEEGKG